MSSNDPYRCAWCRSSERMMAYHDSEWGVPLHDDRGLFEYLVLDAFQAGLSWAIILDKREGFRQAFAGFDPEAVARFTPARIARLTRDTGIVRNRQKIEATVVNARRFLDVQEAHGSFDRYIWTFVDGVPRVYRRRRMQQIPATSRASDAMSTALKALGFKFVGSTICYAFMQAAGMVNDHVIRCFRWEEVQRHAR
jgi:DNA-3-methyladenine glycosylase I